MIKAIAQIFLKLVYRELSRDTSYPVRTLLRYAWKQKIRGFNRCVPWPVHFTSTVKGFKNIKRGTKYPGYAPGVYIDGRNGIEFGKNVWVGPKVSIISQNHNNCDFDTYVNADPIKIGNNSILYAGCIILPGVVLGEHTVVAAGAVVTKSFAEGNIMIGGNPAQIIKKLDPYKE